MRWQLEQLDANSCGADLPASKSSAVAGTGPHMRITATLPSKIIASHRQFGTKCLPLDEIGQGGAGAINETSASALSKTRRLSFYSMVRPCAYWPSRADVRLSPVDPPAGPRGVSATPRQRNGQGLVRLAERTRPQGASGNGGYLHLSAFSFRPQRNSTIKAKS